MVDIKNVLPKKIYLQWKLVPSLVLCKFNRISDRQYLQKLHDKLILVQSFN